ncbi:MAG: hypothetical protein SWQ30_18880 [Thermodesulfobacteriota bacterium]|nr:hypothetical protein [Thermodesulfobacteriota bacterium]
MGDPWVVLSFQKMSGYHESGYLLKAGAGRPGSAWGRVTGLARMLT